MKKERYTYTVGNVHTAQYFTPGYAQECRDTFGVIREVTHRAKDNRLGHTFVYNPNKTSDFGGEAPCMSYEHYAKKLEYNCRLLRTEEEPSLRRIDFKIDLQPNSRGELEKRWAQLGVFMICCFKVYKRVKERNSSITTSLELETFQSIRASTDGFTLKLYNKRLQKPAEGVPYRLELTRRPRTEMDEIEALDSLRSLVQVLPRYSAKAVEMCNKRLLSAWENMEMGREEPSGTGVFLRNHANFIFTREQINQFYQAIGKSSDEAKIATDNFVKRNKQFLILFKQSELEEYCNKIYIHIKDFIEGNNNFASYQKWSPSDHFQNNVN